MSIINQQFYILLNIILKHVLLFIVDGVVHYLEVIVKALSTTSKQLST